MNLGVSEAAMPVVHLYRRRPTEPSQRTAPAAPRKAAVVRPFGRNGDEALVLDLARAAAVVASAPRPRPAGLLSELAATSDRRVAAWLAVADPGPSSLPLGLVTLVTSGPAALQRHSIAWLLVHPDARRTGVGRLLAEQACRRAWQAAAARVWVECLSDWTEAMAFWRALGFAAGGPVSG